MVIIPDGVKAIRDQAFISCFSLAALSIPDSVTTIGSGAFTYCWSLTNVTIGKGVTSIGSRAFASCTSLAAILMDPQNPAYTSWNGVLFNKNQTTLVQCPAGKSGNYIVPAGVKTLGGDAFTDCGKLTGVILPSGLTSIEGYAFASCTNLTTMTIPETVTYIGDRAFVVCTGLTTVYFAGNAPWYDGFYLFYNAGDLTVYYLPGSSGWGKTFALRPAVLWNPTIDPREPGFGIQTNQFGFGITGNPGLGGSWWRLAPIWIIPPFSRSSQTLSRPTPVTSAIPIGRINPLVSIA